MNADDLSIRKQLGECIERDAVRRIIERWNEHNSVGNVEIRIAGREPLAVENHWLGHGQLDDAQGNSILVTCRLQPAQVFRQRFMIRFFGAWLDNSYDGSCVYKPRQVVDVAMSVVALDAPPKPNNMAGPEVISEDLLDARAIESGVAGLDLAEQAFLGREQGSASVDVEGAPLP